MFSRADIPPLKQRYGEDLKVVRLNIDYNQYYYRLWSIADNQILYYLSNFSRARAKKHRMIDQQIR